MKYISALFIITVALYCCGCVATVHPGHYAREITVEGSAEQIPDNCTGLLISGREVKEYSSTYFGVVDFVFENKSGAWITLDSVSVDFGQDNIDKAVEIPLGRKIRDWAIGIKNRNDVRQYNRSLGVGLATAVGVLLMGSDDADIRKLGGAAALAGITITTVENISKNLDVIHNSDAVPENYLIGNTISIPPGLFKKYWILFYTPAPQQLPAIYKLYLNYTRAGEKKRMELEFRKVGENSEWKQGGE